MDEIEMRQSYNEAVKLINDVAVPGYDLRKALNLMLQMIWDVHERLVDMQMEEEDDE
jgi:hypothetical protein